MDAVQVIQSHQYHEFPYHYLPALSADGRTFKSSKSWMFSLSYVTALHHVSSAIRGLKSKSHIDVGCGDGALVNLLRVRHPDIRLAGIDYDAKAIDWARMFNPGETFYSGDLHDADLGEDWSTASLVEVIEHIPPDDLPRFVAGVRRLLKKDARLIVTVPHQNKGVSTKHYQHFSFDKITSTLAPHFERESMFGFEFFPTHEKLYRRFFCRPSFYLESDAANRYRLRYQTSRKDAHERECGRLFGVFKAV